MILYVEKIQAIPGELELFGTDTDECGGHKSMVQGSLRAVHSLVSRVVFCALDA